MVVRLALAPWTARLTLAIVVLFPVGGAPVPATARACAARCGVRWRPPRPGGPGGACGQGTSSRARGSTWSACGAACRSWWSRSAWRRPCGSSSSARGLLWGADRRRATAGRRLAVRGGRTGGLAPAGRRGRALAALGLAGREHRDHVAPILAGGAVDLGDLDEVGGQPLQQPPPELGVGHLAAAEHDGDLDLVALLEEALDVALLGLVVVRVDLGPHLHLFERHQVLLAPGLLGLDGLLVLELRVVHQLADRRAGHRGDLDEVEVELAGHPHRCLGVHHPELLAVGPDHPDLGGPDTVVDPGFNADATSLPRACAQNENTATRAAPPGCAVVIGRPPGREARR